MKRLDKRGDTIVEVLIAIVIVSSILVSSYALSNSNVNTMMTIKEQGEAQKLAERQIELLRQQPDATVMTGKCFNETSTIVASCAAVDANGKTVDPASYRNAIYSIEISKPDAYVIKVTWDTVSGSKTTITLYYYV